MQATYVHTNLVARDWRSLAGFYQRAFGCTPVPPERDISGPELEAATGIAGARLRGCHLRLPGEKDGPTLEIFEYEPAASAAPPAVNRPGFGHVAFAVEDVASARDAVVAAGGHPVGQLVSVRVPEAGIVEFVYVRDPEGNILELQSWTR